MTPNFISGHNRIYVFETTLTIHQNILSVFNVIIQSPQSTISLIRYPFDFMEFHNKIRIHYPKSKVSFPTLRNPSNRWRRLKRRSFREIITFSRRSNAEKIELYLERCFQHPIISISSILKDFLSVQRDEDAQLTSQYATSTTLVPECRPLIKNKPFSLDDLTILKVLGKGCMGKVFLTRSKRDHGLYALKVIKKKWVIQQNELEHTRAERDILVKLRNQPFLVNMHCLFQSYSELYLVLDYYPGGDIATQLSLKTTFTEEQTRFYAAEILEGLSILHKNGIVYRDLKPENVLIHRTGHIVLTDFGLSKILTDDDIGEDGAPVTRTFCGTAEYLAPEILIGEPYTFVVDFWSLGTLVYEMLVGATPFWASNHMEMYRRVLDNNLMFPTHFDPITCNFISGLLEKNAYIRLGWGEHGIQEIKTHAYFSTIDWDQVSQGNLTPPYIPTFASDTDLTHFDETFTTMDPRISDSSGTFPPSSSTDPFEGFPYDPFLAPMQHNHHGHVKHRQSSALSFPASELNQSERNKPSTSRPPTNAIEEGSSSIYSQSSLAFSSVPPIRMGSDASEDLQSQPIERPSCPVPGQSRIHMMGHSHSTISTLTNSMGSDITVHNTETMVEI